METSCQDIEARLDDLVAGRLAAGERRAAEAHLAGCAACRLLVDVARDSLVDLAGLGDDDLPAADVSAAVLARTSGSACGGVQARLCELIDATLDADDTQLVRLHLDHCERCSALHATLLWLDHELPRLAELDPGALLTRAVLEATAPLRHRRQSPLEHLRQWWRRAQTRPRFAWEAAYIGTLVLVLLFGTSISPFRQVPQEALAMLRVEPVAAITGTSRRLVDLHGAVGAAGTRAWDATGQRVVEQAEAWGGGYAERHPGLAENVANLRAHGSALRRSLRAWDFAGSSLLASDIGHDLGGIWRAATQPPPAAAGP